VTVACSSLSAAGTSPCGGSGSLEAGQPIVYQGDPEGKTILHGSVVWDGQWTRSDLHAGYTAPIDFLGSSLFPVGEYEKRYSRRDAEAQRIKSK
jgi:hypothetical protein